MFPSPQDQPTLTVDEAARLLGVAPTTVYEAVKRNELPSLKVGRRVLIPTAALRQALHSTPSELTPTVHPPLRVPRRRKRKDRLHEPVVDFNDMPCRNRRQSAPAQ